MGMFRNLRADEIDCRISQIKTDGEKPLWVSLLLYKDARCDQNILDETFGAFGWQKEYTRDNRNCIVSVWDAGKAQWISKEDTGTESNTEKEKGLASDSFKRACFCWGIGRALYTAPFIKITPDKCKITVKNGRAACYDNFVVTDIDYKDGNICYLTIKNSRTNNECFRWGAKGQEQTQKSVAPDNEPDVKPAPATVTKTEKVPQTVPADPVPPVLEYLAKEREALRVVREIGKAENNALWKEQLKVLLAAGIFPNKALGDYTMEEANALVSAMYDRFDPTGTVLKDDRNAS